MLSGWMKSVKGLLGYENLEVEQGGGEVQENLNNDDRQSLWKQLSSYIGKDITSMISLPIWVFEPISFLQIMCEPMEYADLLEKASETEDPALRMAYLMAFIASGYSCAVRSKKPFNPILGETFEQLDKNNKWKFFAEQVSHHPPIGVAMATSDKFMLLLEMELKTKFRGNSSDVMVLGSNHFSIPKFGDHYEWGHLETCAHNIIIGGMWVDHFGTLDVMNTNNSNENVLKGTLRFTKSGWLGAGRFDTNADITDEDGNIVMKVTGKWNEYLNAIPVKNGVDGEAIPLWKKGKPPVNKWGHNAFVEQLCEFDDEYAKILPENDSRKRGDRFHLEKGDLETAGKEKIRLEEKQRAERKEREAKGEEWIPRYFKRVDDEKWGHTWEYYGNYWEKRKELEEELQSKKKKKSTTAITEEEDLSAHFTESNKISS